LIQSGKFVNNVFGTGGFPREIRACFCFITSHLYTHICTHEEGSRVGDYIASENVGGGDL